MTRHLAAAGLSCALLVSCGGGAEPNEIEVGSIVATPNPIIVMQEQTTQLQVSVLDPDGALLSGVAVSFTSANFSIVTVSNVGLVTSVGPAGSTSISIKAGNKTQSVPVTVTATSSSIIINPEPRDLPQLGTLQLESELIDITGSPIPDAVFEYASANPEIATVSSTGLVSSVGPAGVATIVVRSGDIQAAGAVTVQQVATSLKLTPATVIMLKGTSVQFLTTVADAVGEPMSVDPGPVTYSASPMSLLSISSLGELTAADQAGEGSVAITNGALSGSATVRVVDLGPLSGSVLHHIPVVGLAYGVALSSSGTIVGVGVQGTLHLGSLSSASMETSTIVEDVTIGVVVNAGGDRAYVTGSGVNGLMEIDLATGQRLRTWEVGNFEQMFDAVFSPDGQTIYVAGATGTIYPINVSTFVSGPTIASDGASIVHLLHHPTTPLLYSSGEGHAREINTLTGESRELDVGNAAQASALALAQNRLFVARGNQNLDVIDLATGQTTTVAIPNCLMYDIVAMPSGEALLATCTFSSTVKLIDPVSATPVVTIPVGGDPRRVAISADGSRAVVANQSGWFDIIQ